MTAAAGGRLLFRMSPSPSTRDVLHTAEDPFPCGGDMDQNPITDSRVGEAVGLIEPAADGARIALHLGREGLKIEIVLQEVC